MELQHSRLQARRKDSRVVRAVEKSHEPVSIDRRGQARERGRAGEVRHVEGHDPVSAGQADTGGTREENREGARGRDTREEKENTAIKKPDAARHAAPGHFMPARSAKSRP